MDLTTQSNAAEPRPAATVVLLRDPPGGPGPEVLLTVRPRSMRFMGGAAVFPGGAVDAADRDPRWEQASALSGADCAALLAIEDERLALGYFVCALREAFEEVGFPPLNAEGGSLSRDDADDATRWLEGCLRDGIVLATDALVPSGRWVTPLGSPVRFDTRFFLRRVPASWEPSPNANEVEACFWISPQEALDDVGEGRLLMAPPTIEMLQRLAEFASADEALTAARGAEPTAAETILSVRLSPVVHVVLAPNPGLMTGPGTNTYIVGVSERIVIDPAVDDEAYLEAVVAAAGTVSEIVVTHRHPDHVGGVAALGARTGARVRAYGDAPAGDVPVHPLDDGDLLEIPGARLRALHTPGHASDHLCFLLEGAASLFSGDTILGEGTAVIAPPDGDMSRYMATLRRLQAIHLERIYPGHFRPVHGGDEVVAAYIAHRVQRGAAVLEALGDGPLSAEEIVAVVYTDTPEVLHPIAVYSVKAHLEMAAAEGLVELRGERWHPTRNRD